MTLEAPDSSGFLSYFDDDPFDSNLEVIGWPLQASTFLALDLAENLHANSAQDVPYPVS